LLDEEERMKRRDFLKASFTGATAFALSGLTLMVPRRSTVATLVDIDLVAEGDFKTMADGSSVYVWQFRDPVGSGPGALTSGLLVQEGDIVNVTVENHLDRPINFVIPIGQAMGLSGPMVVMPSDGSKTLYSGGPGFDRQYTLVLNELDDRLNEALYSGQSFDMADLR
jgi:hypothetical protein